MNLRRGSCRRLCDFPHSARTILDILYAYFLFDAQKGEIPRRQEENRVKVYIYIYQTRFSTDNAGRSLFSASNRLMLKSKQFKKYKPERVRRSTSTPQRAKVYISYIERGFRTTTPADHPFQLQAGVRSIAKAFFRTRFVRHFCFGKNLPRFLMVAYDHFPPQRFLQIPLRFPSLCQNCRKHLLYIQFEFDAQKQAVQEVQV